MAPTVGWFAADSKGRVVLVGGKTGSVWGLEKVSILSGSFGFAEEGVEKLPRVYRYDDRGEELVQGDRVLIDFVNGNTDTPVVRGGVRAMSPNAFLHYNHDAEGADENRLAMRLRILDAEGQGEEKGLVEFEAGHDEGGNVTLTLDGALTITVKRDDGDHTIVIDDEGIKIDAGGSTDVTVNGGTAKVARVGDKTVAHAHTASSMFAGFIPVSGTTSTEDPAIAEGAERFKG